MSIIKHIKIENLSYKMDNENYEDRLNDLSKINIFVGANNTGKSRFMRSLFFNDGISLKFLPNDELLNEYNKNSMKFKSNELSIVNPYSNEKQKAYNDIKKALKEITYIEESTTPLPELIRVYKTGVINDSPEHEHILKPYSDYFKEFFPYLEFNDNLFRYDFYKIYIPSLRGLVPIDLNENHDMKKDLYADRIKKDYFSDNTEILTDISNFLVRNTSNIDLDPTIPSKEYIENHRIPKNSIITGQQFYQYVRNYLLGDLEQREMIRDYELYLSETFFDNKEVVLIPKVNDDVLTVRIDNEEYKIYELGEGIQSIILITLPLFLYLEKSKEKNTNVLVFIEEPEVGLHPRLQRKLIKTLLNKRFESYQFFFTTHSNHFIDQRLLDDNISVYLFDKKLGEELSKPKFNISNIDNDYWDVMKKLGAVPSSVLMSNCTILVEGVTDKHHFQLYLYLFQKQLPENCPKFKSGIHYSFLIAGGDEYKNTIKSLNQLQKEKIFFISDYDSEEKNKKRIEFFKEHSFKNYYILNVTEVENLVHKDIVIKTLENTYDTSELKLNKDFKQEAYCESENFYEFIKQEILNNKTPNKFANKKGELKKPLCRNEKRYTNDYNDLTKEAKEVAKKIYDFIDENN